MSAYDPDRTSMIPATKKKLDEARFFFGYLSTEGRPLAASNSFDFYLSAFLSAGRSVINVFIHECQHQYNGWYHNWRDNDISADERDLVEFFRARRSDSVHKTGAKVVVRDVVIPMEEFMQEVSHRGWQIYMHSGVPGTRPPDVIGKIRSFPSLDDQDVVVVCRNFLDLLSRLVSDFELHVGS